MRVIVVILACRHEIGPQIATSQIGGQYLKVLDVHTLC